MYVCMCVYVCMYAGVYVGMYVCIVACVYICMCVHQLFTQNAVCMTEQKAESPQAVRTEMLRWNVMTRVATGGARTTENWVATGGAQRNDAMKSWNYVCNRVATVGTRTRENWAAHTVTRYVCMYESMYVWIHVCMYAGPYVCIYVHTCPFVYTLLLFFTRMYVGSRWTENWVATGGAQRNDAMKSCN